MLVHTFILVEQLDVPLSLNHPPFLLLSRAPFEGLCVTFWDSFDEVSLLMWLERVEF